MPKLVNGPINAFRLEGRINNINKVFYFFGDWHQPIHIETKCDSYTSDDFINYFHKTMEQTDQTIKYDFVHETYYNLDMFESYKHSGSPYRLNYISEIIKYIDRDADIKGEGIRLKNSGSKTIPNLRLHYLDIRNFFDTMGMMVLIGNVRHNMQSYNYTPNTYYVINRSIVDCSNLKNEIKFLLNYLSVQAKGKEKRFKNIVKIDDARIMAEIDAYANHIPDKQERMDKYSSKIFKRYNSREVLDKLIGSDVYKQIFAYGKATISGLNYCLRKLLQMNEVGKYNGLMLHKLSDNTYHYDIDYDAMNKLVSGVQRKINKIDTSVMNMYSNITDLYCLRRLLDKDYITHAIVYSGIYHTNDYIRTLVREFGFEITNMEYSALGLKQTNELLRSGEEYDWMKMFLKPEFKQCSDMSKFPPNFT